MAALVASQLMQEGTWCGIVIAACPAGAAGVHCKARNNERRTVRMREHQDVAKRSKKQESGSGFEALGNFEDFSDGVPVAAGAGSFEDFVHARPGKFGFALAIGKVNEQFATDEMEFLWLNR